MYPLSFFRVKRNAGYLWAEVFFRLASRLDDDYDPSPAADVEFIKAKKQFSFCR